MFKKIVATLVFIVCFIPTMALAGHNHTVQSGDTLYKIAQKNGTTINEIVALNRINNPNLIYVGQVINLPHSITAEERDLLARIVHAESKGEPYLGQVAVATVVLNRVDHKYFPNTIKEVIYQKGQFEPVMNGSVYEPANDTARKAVNDALAYRGMGAGLDSLFFYNPSIAVSRWLDTRETTVVIGNHTFKK